MVRKDQPSEADVSKVLVARIVSGDESAETEMIQRYHRGLTVALFRIANDHQIVEDAIQETWIVVISKVRTEQLRDTSKLAAFIIQTGRNQLTMQFRKQSRSGYVSEADAPEAVDKGLTPEQSIQNTQKNKLITQVFIDMNQERDSVILKKFYLTGASKQTLCEELDLSPAHFDRVIYRARARFKKIWSSYQQEEA